jgi:hypothetical protein
LLRLRRGKVAEVLGVAVRRSQDGRTGSVHGADWARLLVSLDRLMERAKFTSR